MSRAAAAAACNHAYMQVRALKADPEVRSVEPNSVITAAVDTASFLGLTGPTGAWAQVGGEAKAGKGITIGFIDSGIWPEHPSFTPARDKSVPNGLTGTLPPNASTTAKKSCPAEICFGRIVQCRFYNKGLGGDEGVLALFPNEVCTYVHAPFIP